MEYLFEMPVSLNGIPPFLGQTNATSMEKLKSTHIAVTDEEDRTITAAALSDPDAIPLTEAEWQMAKPLVRLGRPKAKETKQLVTIRLSRDVVNQFRATGNGWQTRMDFALRQFITEHPLEAAPAK